MGRAIVRDPVLFLFDKPLSNLDAKLRVQMRAKIKDLRQRLGTTTIYVTHDQVEAMTMADKIVVMRDGNVERIGAPLELYDHPHNVFVAGFIGLPLMNFLQATMGHDGFWTTDGCLLSTQHHRALATTYGIRPEHLHLDPAGVEIEAVVIEPIGSETQVVARLGEQPLVAVFRERLSIKPHERLRVMQDLGSVHLFAVNRL